MHPAAALDGRWATVADDSHRCDDGANPLLPPLPLRPHQQLQLQLHWARDDEGGGTGGSGLLGRRASSQVGRGEEPNKGWACKKGGSFPEVSTQVGFDSVAAF